MKVYAVGSMAGAEGGKGGEWRESLPTIPNVEWILPRVPPGATKENGFRPEFFVPRDLVAMRQCDLVLAVFEEGGEVPQHGTCTEIGMAYERGIPIVAVCPDEDAAFVFRFPLTLATSTVPTVDHAIEVIRFMVGEPSWDLILEYNGPTIDIEKVLADTKRRRKSFDVVNHYIYGPWKCGGTQQTFNRQAVHMEISRKHGLRIRDWSGYFEPLNDASKLLVVIRRSKGDES